MTNIVNFYRKLNKSYAFYTKLLKIYILQAIDSIIFTQLFPFDKIRLGKSHFFFQSNIFHQCDFKIECFQKHNENVREYIYDNID